MVPRPWAAQGRRVDFPTPLTQFGHRQTSVLRASFQFEKPSLPSFSFVHNTTQYWGMRPQTTTVIQIRLIRTRYCFRYVAGNWKTAAAPQRTDKVWFYMKRNMMDVMWHDCDAMPAKSIRLILSDTTTDIAAMYLYEYLCAVPIVQTSYAS